MIKLILIVLTMGLFIACNGDDNTVTEIVPNAGTILGGPFAFLIDAVPDMMTGVTTDPLAVGTNRTFVITDADSIIFGMPPTNEAFEAVDFDEAGVGSCLIWYLRFEGHLLAFRWDRI